MKPSPGMCSATPHLLYSSADGEPFLLLFKSKHTNIDFPPVGTKLSKNQTASNGPSHSHGKAGKGENKELAALFKPNIDSFDFFLDEGLPLAVANLDPMVIQHKDLPGKFEYWYDEVTVGMPSTGDDAADTRLFPTHCRERALSYTAPLMATICYRFDGGAVERYVRKLGEIPVMVKSSRCHLQGLSPKELVARHEEQHEMGGYFICNGIERLVRMLQIPRRNYVQALDRSAFQKRGREYSSKACTIRCVRPDHSAVTVALHYLHDGNAMVKFSLRKQEFFIPVVLMAKALVDTSDKELYDKVLRGDHTNTFLSDRLELILRDNKKFGLYTRDDCLAYIGSRFRIMTLAEEDASDVEVGKQLIRKFVFVHLDRNEEKFELLLHMMRKLYAFVAGDVAEDNADALMNQEILLTGHLFTTMVKEKLEEYFVAIKSTILKELRTAPTRVHLNDSSYFKKTCDRQQDIGQKIYYFLATGNLRSTSGLDLMQVSGFTVVAEKLNFYRYLSHFRSVHRGQFFTEMKTTQPRKLLPESWGFLCPVHTPDGSPCGLLNHLTADALVVTHPEKTGGVEAVLCALGMTASGKAVLPYTYLTVLLDGRVIGGLPVAIAKEVAAQLRVLKTTGSRGIPKTLEVALILPTPTGGGTYPGIYLSGDSGRLVRPVKHLAADAVEWIGVLEQPWMDIACVDSDRVAGVTTHQERHPTAMLSLIASLTPFSDFNQSPRNMYQCQMGKQTMGSPATALDHRCDNKLYRIQSPQAPIVQNAIQRVYNMDDYPNGTNAVVAVISYTGYDMEDAMILSKSSFERGFGHGSVYKTEVIDLQERKKSGAAITSRFGKPPAGEKGKGKGGKMASIASLDSDGLPPIGLHLKEGDAKYCVLDEVTGKMKVGKHKLAEPCIVDQVRLLGSSTAGELQKVSIKTRYDRNPVVGDKFSSRHGQKGVLSVLWPQADMPFSESGMSPDVIINPHAFPSRMTIGMLIESMAGKAGAMHGAYQDSTPFRFHEKHRAVDYFGEQLVAAGYSYYGSEPLYSGTSGVELHADIFMGVVYYQRLRHMVSDKSQVRSTGPLNQLTRQPVKGRKRHGGIRFGEMERDSLLSHGTAFLLHDRLMNCSDKHIAFVCTRCGSLLSPIAQKPSPAAGSAARPMRCQSCNTSRSCASVAMPYVFRYLANELAAMNIRLSLSLRSL